MSRKVLEFDEISCGDSLASSSDDSMNRKVFSVQITVDGVLCYYEDFSGKEDGPLAEPLLVTGLLSAMAALVREITKKGVLRKIESPPVKFFASQAVETPQVIVSMFTDIDFPDYLCDIVLGDISQFFLEKYVGCLISWTGENLTMELSPHLRRIVQEDIEKYSGREPIESRDLKNPAISGPMQRSQATSGL